MTVSGLSLIKTGVVNECDFVLTSFKKRNYVRGVLLFSWVDFADVGAAGQPLTAVTISQGIGTVGPPTARFIAINWALISSPGV